MDDRTLEAYAPKVFGYCIKRLSNIEDAKDLTQEILLEVFVGMRRGNIQNIDAWVWKVAHNRYARFIAAPRPVFAQLEENLPAAGLPQPNEQIAAVFRAVHSLAASHRDILVDCYIHRLPYEQIASKYGLPVNTVKTRLFYGKQKLKERWHIHMEQQKIYGSVRWFISGNGDVDPHKYLARQIARAIVTACYQKGLEVEELSLATGLPCLYIEDELPMLLQGEILKKQGEKYRGNIIVFSQTLSKSIETLLLQHSQALAEDTALILRQFDSPLRQVGFHGSIWPMERLGWVLIPMLLRRACEDARQLHGKAARGAFPLRKDGGKGWIFVNEAPDEAHRYFSGCNGYWRDAAQLTYYWSSKYNNEALNHYLYRLEDVPRLDEAGALDAELLAQGIRLHVIEKTADGFAWNIPVFTSDQRMQLDSLLPEMAASLARQILPLVQSIYALMVEDIPKHLQDQLGGVFGAELNAIIAMVCECLEPQNLLAPPVDDFAASQVLMTLRG